MGLFDKKYCSICGEKIGFLGNRKLEDGNLCKTCARKLSPFFSERRHSTVEEIREQLAYREENQGKVAVFHPTRTFNCREYLILDEDKKQLIVTDHRNWKDENPDVVDFADVTGCDIDVAESRREIYRKDANGKSVSYEPKRYEYSYNFNMTIAVNNPYFTGDPPPDQRRRDQVSDLRGIPAGGANGLGDPGAAAGHPGRASQDGGSGCGPQEEGGLPLLRRHHHPGREGLLRVLRRSRTIKKG